MLFQLISHFFSPFPLFYRLFLSIFLHFFSSLSLSSKTISIMKALEFRTCTNLIPVWIGYQYLILYFVYFSSYSMRNLFQWKRMMQFYYWSSQKFHIAKAITSRRQQNDAHRIMKQRNVFLLYKVIDPECGKIIPRIIANCHWSQHMLQSFHFGRNCLQNKIKHFR